MVRAFDRRAPRSLTVLHWPLIRLARDVRVRAESVDALVEASLASGTIDGYRRFLCDLYGFVLAYEARFAFASFLELAFIVPRVRSGRIASDLLALGLTADEFRRLALRCHVPAFDEAAAAFGWIFVVERIAARRDEYRRMVRRGLPTSFLATAAGEIEQQWGELGAAIERCVVEDRDAQRLKQGALAALAGLEAWLALDTSSSVLVDAMHVQSA